MARVKRGTIKTKRRRNLLAQTKGMRRRIATKERAAHEALLHAGNHAFQDRRKKKGQFRRLWTIRLNASLRADGMTYSRFVHLLKKEGVAINRKMLAEMAQSEPEAFVRLLAHIRKSAK